MKRFNIKQLTIVLESLKNKNGRMIVLPTIVFVIDTEYKEFGFSIAFLWYVFTVNYYYGKNLDC